MAQQIINMISIIAIWLTLGILKVLVLVLKTK